MREMQRKRIFKFGLQPPPYAQTRKDIQRQRRRQREQRPHAKTPTVHAHERGMCANLML